MRWFRSYVPGARPLTLALLQGLVLAAAPAAVAAQPSRVPPSDGTTGSYQRARRLLDASLEAHGGRARLQRVAIWRVAGRGLQHHPNQSVTPEPPFSSAERAESLVVDLGRGRMRAAVRSAFPGLPISTLTLLDGERGAVVDRLARTAAPLAGGRLALGHPALRQLPHFILLEADARAVTLRALGTATRDGRPHDLIGFVRLDGQAATLWLDARTHLLSRMETLVPDAAFGDSRTEIDFPGYRRQDGLALPTGRVQRNGGLPWHTIAYEAVVADADVREEEFTVPTGLTELAAAPARGASSRELAPGVWVVEGLGNFNSLVIAQRDRVIAVDGPAPTPFAGSTEALLAEVRRLLPGRAVDQVVLTHHHSDHAGGARAYAAAGVPMLVTAMTARLVPTMLAAPFTITPDTYARAPRPPRLELMTERRRTLADAERPVEVLHVGPSPHAAEMLVVYLPRQRILFQADLLTAGADGRVAGVTPAAAHLVRIVDSLGLEVETLVGAHGGVARFADLRAAVAASMVSPAAPGGHEGRTDHRR